MQCQYQEFNFLSTPNIEKVDKKSHKYVNIFQLIK